MTCVKNYALMLVTYIFMKFVSHTHTQQERKFYSFEQKINDGRGFFFPWSINSGVTICTSGHTNHRVAACGDTKFIVLKIMLVTCISSLYHIHTHNYSSENY